MNIGIKDIPGKFVDALNTLRRYAVVIFLVLTMLVYSYLVLRVNSLQNAQPSEVTGTSKVNTVVTPHIDEKIVHQLQQLQDNSVSVKALFDQARSNPFQE